MCNLTWKLKRSIPALEVTQYLPFKARQFAKYTNTYWDAFGRFKLGLPCCRTKLLSVELAQDNTTCRHYYHYYYYYFYYYYYYYCYYCYHYHYQYRYYYYYHWYYKYYYNQLFSFFFLFLFYIPCFNHGHLLYALTPIYGLMINIEIVFSCTT